MTVDQLVICTLVLAAAIVVVLAGYLIGIAIYLYRASRHLEELAQALATVRDNAGPLESHLTTIANALSALENELRTVDANLKKTAEIRAAS